MHSIRTYLLQALAEPAARGSDQFGDAALDGRLPWRARYRARHPPRPEVHSARLRARTVAGIACDRSPSFTLAHHSGTCTDLPEILTALRARCYSVVESRPPGSWSALC